MSDELYAITNLEGYALEMRQAAANSLTEDDCTENLDEFITLKQMMNLIKSECVGFDADDRPLLNEDVNEKIYDSTINWLNGVGLAKLAAKDLIQCAWDSNTNEMVFWANPSITDTKKRNKNGANNKRRNKKKDS